MADSKNTQAEGSEEEKMSEEEKISSSFLQVMGIPFSMLGYHTHESQAKVARNRALEEIDHSGLINEYRPIKQKKSQLSRSQRDAIENKFNRTFQKI